MNRALPIALLVCLVWFGCLSVPVGAAAATATYTGGGWTLTLTFRQATYGQTMSGTFHSAHTTFHVQGDWIPAADQGSDLLRFYGHPFGVKSPMGLVGVATLANTCTPTCVASKRYRLVEVSVSPQVSAKVPGVGKAALLLQLHP
jgi:hypothetical protein